MSWATVVPLCDEIWLLSHLLHLLMAPALITYKTLKTGQHCFFNLCDLLYAVIIYQLILSTAAQSAGNKD